jgi:hypothetical protein
MNSLNNLSTNPATFWVLTFVIIVCAAVIGYRITREGMENTPAPKEVTPEVTPEVTLDKQAAQNLVDEILDVQPEEPIDFATAPADVGIAAITPENLLPIVDEVRDFEKAFKTGKDGLDRNFVAAGHHIGINTVASSLRNANLTLRSDPVIPRVDVGPWNSSTIMASDIVNRKKFEIGSSI